MRGAQLYGRRSAVIWQDKHGYVARGAQLCGRRSAVIWQDMHGYVARGARLYDAMILMLAHALLSDQNLKA